MGKKKKSLHSNLMDTAHTYTKKYVPIFRWKQNPRASSKNRTMKLLLGAEFFFTNLYTSENSVLIIKWDFV